MVSQVEITAFLRAITACLVKGLFWVTTTLDDSMPGVPGPEPEFLNFEKLRSPGIDSKVSIPPAWRFGTANRVVVKARQDT